MSNKYFRALVLIHLAAADFLWAMSAKPGSSEFLFQIVFFSTLFGLAVLLMISILTEDDKP